MSEISVGDAAPAFRMAGIDAAGNEAPVALGDHAGKKVVLYFYPKDDTPGCTNEGKGFTALANAFAAADTVVIGCSRDHVASHAKFRKKHELGVALGADEDGSVTEAYGVWVSKSMYGKSYMGIERATFLIGRDGKVAQVWRKVKVPGHAEAVLAAAEALD
ncbi:MAG: peroxiredoxin [Polymorphobacter sp.]|uniref:peroxiredoxin n=1 Tax=Polymorphobacter sp. TaxID=1909290 RepID=UPI003A858F96